MRRNGQVAMVGAVAAIAGGLFWILKGGVILAVGTQPPWLFELAGLLFPMALIGLHRRLDGNGGRPALVGGLLARLAGVTAVVAGAYGLLAADPSEVVLGVAIGLCGLSTVVGLILLGAATRATDVLPGRWRNLPFAMGVAAIPAMTIVGGILEAIHERLLELPIVAYGVAWVVLGVALGTSHAPAERTPGAMPKNGSALA